MHRIAPCLLLTLAALIACHAGEARPEHGPAPAAEARAEDSAGGVAFEGRLSHPWVLEGAAQEVYVQLTIDAKRGERVPRAPMNLALVIDRSGSMASQDKLELAKDAAMQLFARLEPEDRLALVAYDDRVETLVPSSAASERELFRAAIRALVPGNSTDLCGGMLAGYEALRAHRDPLRTSRVLLVSDGLANAGVRDPSAIATRAGELRASGVAVSTLGVGIDYDEALLESVAARSGGRYHYIGDSEEIGRYLEQELDDLERVVARDVEVTLELGEGIELRDACGYAHERRGRSVRIPLPDLLDTGRRRVILLRLGVVDEVRAAVPIVSAAIAYRRAATSERVTTSLPELLACATTQRGRVEESRDVGVLAQAQIALNAEALRESMGFQKEGEIERAKAVLLERLALCSAALDAGDRSPAIAQQLDRMSALVVEIERTALDRHARRDLQLGTELQALAYLGYL